MLTTGHIGRALYATAKESSVGVELRYQNYRFLSRESLAIDSEAHDLGWRVVW